MTGRGVKDLRNLEDETRSELWDLFIGSAGFRHRQLGFLKLHKDVLLRISASNPSGFFGLRVLTPTKGVGATM
jgi:hypothetical protein